MSYLANQLDAAPHGERHSIVELACAALGLSRPTVYRELARVGWTSGRKTRSDKGTTIVPDDTLTFIGTLQRTSTRQNGKVTMTIPTAMSIAAANGAEVKASRATIGRNLRVRGLDVRTQSRASSHVTMRSLHPNHVHQVDASLCLVYYLNGKQGVLREDQFYKNKLEGLAKVRYKCYRWVLTDHFSSTIVPWYTESAGEDQFSLAEFLLFAWSKQEGREFHGVPRILYRDQGIKAHAISALLRGLDVEDLMHAPGKARATGQVEGGHNIVEKEFESRLRLEPVTNISELNDAAFAWANAFNGNQIPHQDTRLHRGPLHVARTDLWHKSREELRFLPDADLCRALLAGKDETRKVSDGLQIQFRHPAAEGSLFYDVKQIDGLSVGDVVAVQPLLYGDCEILVSISAYNGARREWRLAPIRDYDAAGFRLGSAVFGESFKANPQTINEAAGRALDRVAYGEKSLEEIDQAKRKNAAPFDGLVDAHSYLGKVELPQYLPRKGTEINVPNRVTVDAAPLTRGAACKALVAMLGRPLTTEDNRKVGLWYPEGVPEADLPLIATALRTHTTPFRHLGDREASA